MSKRENIVNYFLGSCNNLGPLQEEAFGLSEEEIANILEEEEVFVCEECNWWYGFDEMCESTFERICVECYTDRYYNEEDQ